MSGTCMCGKQDGVEGGGRRTRGSSCQGASHQESTKTNAVHSQDVRANSNSDTSWGRTDVRYLRVRETRWGGAGGGAAHMGLVMSRHFPPGEHIHQ
jgi:hypothetical protein